MEDTFWSGLTSSVKWCTHVTRCTTLCLTQIPLILRFLESSWLLAALARGSLLLSYTCLRANSYFTVLCWFWPWTSSSRCSVRCLQTRHWTVAWWPKGRAPLRSSAGPSHGRRGQHDSIRGAGWLLWSLESDSQLRWMSLQGASIAPRRVMRGF